jgi:hypothetical protein
VEATAFVVLRMLPIQHQQNANSSVQYNADIADLSAKLGIAFKVAMVNEEVAANTDVLESRVECAVAQDCINSGKGTLCVNNACLHEGNPRITLTWVGDDDLDLIVYTPSDVMIAYDADFDPETGGSFDTLFLKKSSRHTLRVYFPHIGRPLWKLHDRGRFV